jgi:hypothetical protein
MDDSFSIRNIGQPSLTTSELVRKSSGSAAAASRNNLLDSLRPSLQQFLIRVEFRWTRSVTSAS